MQTVMGRAKHGFAGAYAQYDEEYMFQESVGRLELSQLYRDCDIIY